MTQRQSKQNTSQFSYQCKNNEVAETEKSLSSSREPQNAQLFQQQLSKNASGSSSDEDSQDLEQRRLRLEEQQAVWQSFQGAFQYELSQWQCPLPSGGNEQATFINLSKPPQIDLTVLPNPKEIKKLEKEINEGDYSSIRKYWYLMDQNIEMRESLDFILDHWQQFRYEYEYRLEKIIHFFQARLSSLNAEITMFPGVKALLKKIEKVTESQAVSGMVNPRPEPVSNSLYHNYIKDLEQRIKNQESLYFIKSGNERLPLCHYIGGSKEFKANRQEWKEIWFETYVQKMAHHTSVNDGLGWHKLTKLADTVMERQRDDLITDLNYLCCAPFFHLNYNLEPEINLNRVTVMTGKKVKSLQPTNERLRKYISREMQGQEPDSKVQKNKMLKKGALDDGKRNRLRRQINSILQDVVALLNSGGGIVLFDTFRSFFDISPSGDILTESDMFIHACVLHEELKAIQPEPSFGTEVRISYVPLIKNPVNWKEIPAGPAQQEFLPGYYVLRLVVVPSKGETLYTLKCENEGWSCATMVEGEKISLSHKEAVQLLKRKMKKYHIPKWEYASPDEEEMLRQMVYNHQTWIAKDHKCVEPHRGAPIQIKERDPQKLEVRRLENEFKEMVLIVAGHQFHKQILAYFEARGISCQIKVFYADKKYDFKAARHSAVLFHNETFSKILGLVGHNPSFKFRGRQMYSLLITKSLKLEGPLKQQNIGMLEKWLLRDYPQEKMVYLGFVDIGEFYVMTESKLSCLLLYFVLNQNNIKAKLKYPTPEIRQQLRVLYQTPKNR